MPKILIGMLLKIVKSKKPKKEQIRANIIEVPANVNATG
jgi:hypothetical protein